MIVYDCVYDAGRQRDLGSACRLLSQFVLRLPRCKICKEAYTLYTLVQGC